MKKSLKSSAAIFCGVLLIIVVWYVAAIKVNNSLLIPSPTETAKEFVALLGEKQVYKSVIGTFKRSLISFAIAFACALAMACAANFSSFVEKLFYPLIAVMRVIPAMAAILMCLLWLKSAKSPIAISFIVVFPMLYASVFGALKNRDKGVSEMLKVYGVSPIKRFFGATFPDVVKRLFPEIVSTLTFNVKLTVSGEALANTALSLGREMYVANAYFETARLIALTVAAILLSVMIEIVLKSCYYFVGRLKREYDRKQTVKALFDR